MPKWVIVLILVVYRFIFVHFCKPCSKGNKTALPFNKVRKKVISLINRLNSFVDRAVCDPVKTPAGYIKLNILVSFFEGSA